MGMSRKDKPEDPAWEEWRMMVARLAQQGRLDEIISLLLRENVPAQAARPPPKTRP